MSSDARRPRAGACVTCRSRKRRCIPTSSGEPCQLCHSLGKPCSLSLVSRPTRVDREPPPAVEERVSNASDDTTTELISRQLSIELVSLYFHYIHDIPHTIFHEPTFMRRINDGTAPMVHIYAMCALAARFSDNAIFGTTAPCDRGHSFATEAVRLCQPYMISPSLETVQGFLLIGYYYSGEGNLDGKHIYVGLARLHAERLSCSEDANAVYQEEYRRAWLSIHVASHWSAWDMAMEPESLTKGPDFLPRIDDATWRTACAEMLNLHQTQDVFRCDMWAQMARTLGVFARIHTLLLQMSHSTISFDDYCSQAAELEVALDQWAENLPPRLTWNFDNLVFLAGRRLGQIYLAMHVGVFHFRQMLFFPFLDARAAKKLGPIQANKCKESAAVVSSILQYCKNIRNCELDYFIYGHIGVVSSCVHLHTLLFSDDFRELSITRQRLVSNFQYLMALKSFWPIVEHHTIHLRTFQNSCRDSISDPFVLDNWMARFLTEHSSLLSERQLGPVQATEPGTPVASERKTGSGNATPAVLPTIEFLTSQRSINDTNPVVDGPVQSNDISRLLHDQEITGEALIDSALSWLLDDRYDSTKVTPT
ncbi:hypothetical protein BDV19DRAFT_377018 [Aspergillus venezuelensis]